ncbi:MAG: peptidase C1A [Chlorobium sp.]|nr:MAG: peptidase C1A [Chlorobium sp.]
MPLALDLKALLERNQATWRVNEKFLNLTEPPKVSLGALTDKFVPATQVKPIDFKTLLAVPTNNPFILERRLAHAIPQTMVSKPALYIGSIQGLTAGEGGGVRSGSTLPSSVDWRNRWGWPWITTVRNQGGSEACWVFGAVALVEAMVRIEHCVWPWISEGDVHKGLLATCCQCGNPENALNWIKDNGAADPGCFAWPVTSAACSGCGGTGGAPYDAVAYTPSSDRSGRSVRIPAFTHVGNVADQKKWLDTTGPLVCAITVWKDFLYYGTGVYHKVATMPNGTANTILGSHIMLIVGYNDSLNCWIAKNSWGTSYGDNGYYNIGYGEVNIDTYAKIGLTGVNPDPWTKRRMGNGGMLESGNGASHRNFELLTTGTGGKVQHWWRNNSTTGFPWNKGTSFGNDAAACPTLISSTFNRNFESVHLTTSHRLHHWWFRQPSGPWSDGGIFGPPDAAGIPGFIQGNYGAPGNFEVVVRTADSKLTHCWKDGGGWHNGVKFGTNVAYSGASLIQSHYGTQGNLEVVCTLASGKMQLFWRDNDHGMVWNEGAQFGSGVSSPPCMIEGSYGAPNEKAAGNFELCVAVGGAVQHWWRNNQGDKLWRMSATFGHNILSVVSLLQGSFGFNIEVIVLRTDNKLQHYWRDGSGWHEGVAFGSIV